MKLIIKEIEYLNRDQKITILVYLFNRLQVGWRTEYIRKLNIKGITKFNKIFIDHYTWFLRNKKSESIEKFYSKEYLEEHENQKRELINNLLNQNDDINIWFEALNNHLSINSCINILEAIINIMDISIPKINVHIEHTINNEKIINITNENTDLSNEIDIEI